MLGPRDLEEFLKSRGIPYRLVEVPEAATSEMASKSLGVDKTRIAKTVVFVSDTGDVVLVVVRSDRRVDQAKLAKLLGYRKLRLARAEEVVEYTGYTPGGVPPIGHARELPVVLDSEVAGGEYWCGGGDERHLLLLDFRNISAQGFKVVDVPKKQ
ncbi:YbaK/EbsC family protein [Infirmifilum lucidum]|uniref:YbaK/EbsC family protein n=1 Tax=Infirmifilum lucidum TaxID=2776706 RepID=A0A7L9FJH7_9CREN|nr:YbaK/EbsC family protein [Infirmifilum lucidum]QOJ79084.1 YbaK/EbsC family protein [Infirmifilum lucidum]